MKQGTKRTTINLDDETTAALDEIVERSGSSKTNALSRAIVAEAERLREKDNFKAWLADYCAEFDIEITDEDRAWAKRKMDEVQDVSR